MTPNLLKILAEDRTPLVDALLRKLESLKRKIHETVVVTPEGLPEGSKLKRRQQFDVQDLIVLPGNTRYILEEWESPDGQTHSV